MRFGTNCDQKWQIVGVFGGGTVTTHSSGWTIFSFPHKYGTTVGVGQEMYEVAGRANDMGLDGIGEVGDS